MSKPLMGLICALTLALAACQPRAENAAVRSRLPGVPTDSPEYSFGLAVASLEAPGDRAATAALFRRTAEAYPQAPCTGQARELAELLEAMAAEDQAWTDPGSVDVLSEEERIGCYIHRLRDLSGDGYDYPVHFLHAGPLPDGAPNPAAALREMGDAAIPALLALLDDRRPTRAVWAHRGARYQSVLRYQDAALQILSEHTPVPFYRVSNTATYFSSEDPAYRADIIRKLKAWWAKAESEGEQDRLWAVIETGVGIYPALKTLETLAFEHGQGQAVREALQAEAAKRPDLQLPQISYLLCRLGDRGRLDDVMQLWKTPRHGQMVALPDDGCATSNAGDYIYKQLILYGEPRHRAYIADIIHGRARGQSDIPVRVMCDLASNRWDQFPKEYRRTEFPVYLLMDALNAETVAADAARSPEQETRLADLVAEAIQAYTKEDFGFDRGAARAERDAAIERINAWWAVQEAWPRGELP